MPIAHRVTGFALSALTIPVAVHCLIAYGVQLTSPRVAIHSIAGCFFYERRATLRNQLKRAGNHL